MNRVLQTGEALNRQLNDQLLFLKASSDAFDKGVDAEAKRLAVALRVLLHDTKSSKSLLGQLGRKSGKFLSTALPFNADNPLTHGGLICVRFGSLFASYVAELDNAPFVEWLDFDEWWGSAIFRDAQRKIMSRRDLVCVIANQDGGAHVDPALDATYYALSRANALNWYTIDAAQSSRPLGDPSGMAVRQIAHEMLRTLDPEYRKKPANSAGTTIGGIEIGLGADAAEKRLQTKKKPERNAPCPCGAGKKYKHCHGAHL